MNASQMEKEFEIAYESIASNGAPGYEAYEKSILLTQAQNDIIKELVASGAERDDIRALVVGPHIKTDAFTDSAVYSYLNPGLVDAVDGANYITNTWDGSTKTTIDIRNSSTPVTMVSAGAVSVTEGGTLSILIDDFFNSLAGIDPASQIVLSGVVTDSWTLSVAADLAELTEGVEIDVTSTGNVNVSIVSTEYAGHDYNLYIATKPASDISVSTMYPTAVVFEKDVSNMWLIVNERVKETSISTPLEVKPVEHTFLDANLSNPYKKPKTGRHFWRLLQYGESTELFTTPNFMIIGLSTFDTYYINYLKKPTPIMVPATSGTIDGVTAGTSVNVGGVGTGINITTSGLDCAFNSLIHRDIVKRAAQLGAAYVGDPESFQLLMNSYNRT